MGLGTLLLMGGAAAVTGGTVTQMRGIQEQADVAVATARYEAGVYKNEAAARRLLSAEEQRLMRENLRSTLKRRKALFAKSGTTMQGSPLQIQLKVVEDMAYDIGTLSHAREMESRGFEQRAKLSMLEAKFARKAGKLQKRQALWGGASKLAMMGMQYSLATGARSSNSIWSGSKSVTQTGPTPAGHGRSGGKFIKLE